jgi:Mn2+/Fe2+ NRAMP family transporter
MDSTTIFQIPLFQNYLLPLALIFALVFGVLEKTKLLGEKKQQLNAIIAIVISIIFVGFVFPKEIVSNLVLFLAVSLVVIFVILLLWGFVMSDKDGFKLENWMKYFLIIVVLIAVVLAVIWASGVGLGGFTDFLFNQSWSNSFWTNVVFVLIVGMVIAAVLKSAKK